MFYASCSSEITYDFSTATLALTLTLTSTLNLTLTLALTCIEWGKMVGWGVI